VFGDLCAPIGALEEPASGTTSAGLAGYLTWHGATSKSAPIIIEQGVEMGRQAGSKCTLTPSKASWSRRCGDRPSKRPKGQSSLASALTRAASEGSHWMTVQQWRGVINTIFL
jgi:hypothetical protein